jgi:hypothetical protein
LSPVISGPDAADPLVLEPEVPLLDPDIPLLEPDVPLLEPDVPLVDEPLAEPEAAGWLALWLLPEGADPADPLEPHAASTRLVTATPASSRRLMARRTLISLLCLALSGLSRRCPLPCSGWMSQGRYRHAPRWASPCRPL